MIPSPAATRARIRMYPVCDARPGGRWCPKVATSAVQLTHTPDASIGYGFASRCSDHADPDAPRICLGCRAENRGRDAWHCGSCMTAAEPEDAT